MSCQMQMEASLNKVRLGPHFKSYTNIFELYWNGSFINRKEFGSLTSANDILHRLGLQNIQNQNKSYEDCQSLVRIVNKTIMGYNSTKHKRSRSNSREKEEHKGDEERYHTAYSPTRIVDTIPEQ